MTAVAGIDLAAGRGVTEIAILLTSPDGSLPHFQLERHQAVVSDEDILAAVAQAAPTVIAIDAPLSLPAAVMQALCGESDANPTTTSSYTRAAERDPIWKTLNLRPLPVSFLGGLTFRAISLLPRLCSAAPAAQIIEVFPSATLRILGVRPVAPQEKRQAKTTPASRATTQAGLIRWIDGLPAADTQLLSADVLDALAAALTGVFFFHGQYTAAGDAIEGQIILPDPVHT